MKDPAPMVVKLADYTPYAFQVDKVELTFRLNPTATRVISKLHMQPVHEAEDLVLMGVGLKLIWIKINGRETGFAPLLPHVGKGIRIDATDVPEGPFDFECEVEINPEANTALEGLYMSGGMYCTQCEAEGFRHITYYPDRPDVMAPFKVRIESEMPVLLSNGNPVSQGTGWAEWDDPWPKPSYLFALVAGNLVAHSNTFTTRSGRKVDLNIWVRQGDEGKCAYAMDALIRSMKWDEDVYGREYDLDVFNIVAVDDFNMGAMENKGLNIFNSKYVLASPETATDSDYENIERIVAHEYFHNWTGNRITCRDWFQLSLKEGLTVFRDQQFSADQRSAAVQRIEDVVSLRARQFREDSGPLAHPVRPDHYAEINNFYTATIYEKGAEVIRMLHRLVGAEAYSKALDLYFERHDGDAATIEDWLQVFEDATGRDLSQFKRWYEQAGTPTITASDHFEDGTYTLTLEQKTPATPSQAEKQPVVIPVAVGLLGPNGDEVVPTRVLELTEVKQSFSFDGLGEKPIPSILRGFSAPVILDRQTDMEERAFLLTHDTDPFNKWEAGRALAKDVLIAMIQDQAAPAPAYLDALDQVLRDDSLDPAFRALTLRLPSEDDIAQTLFDSGQVPDPSLIHSAHEALLDALAAQLEAPLADLFERYAPKGDYHADHKADAERSLRMTAMMYLTRRDGGARASALFQAPANMTEEQSAFAALLSIGKRQNATEAFYTRWKGDHLVLDKWFALQISQATPEAMVSVAENLTQHQDFDWKNPNRFRSVIGAMGGNAAGFHDPSGASYKLVADWLIRLDAVNPQTTARMTTMFESWRRYDVDRQALIRVELERIAATENLSRNTAEMVSRMLEG